MIALTGERDSDEGGEVCPLGEETLLPPLLLPPAYLDAVLMTAEIHVGGLDWQEEL